MKKFVFIFTAMVLMATSVNAKGIERKQLFDFNWQFALNDSTQWRAVNLPHDWSIEGVFDKDAPAGNDGGYLPTGKGWYRKTFTLGKEYSNKAIRLYFEGVYMNSDVYVNGKRAGGHPYGYSAFFVDVTPYIIIGKNEVVVRVDNSQQKNCRWYSGSGIYRHVWLMTTEKLHFDEWGIYIRANQEEGGEWQMCIDAPYVDEAQTGVKPEIRNTLYDAQGNVVATSNDGRVSQTLTVKNPRLWSPENPYLYHVTTQMIVNGKVTDEVTTTTGFRTIAYDSQNGFRLNGKQVLLNGGCIHHDNGVLGAAAYDRAEYRKAWLLKEGGFNAVRTSHNHPSEKFLQACDEVGLLVIDEAFDGWREQKNTYDYHTLIDQWWKEDLKALVARDRNHPSVFCWSIGNEVIERKKIEVVKTAHQLATFCRQLDEGRRPVTSALCAWDRDWDIYDPLAAEHDIVGYNYMIMMSERDHERVPQRVMMQTESYPRDAWRNYRKVKDFPYVIGDFVWTAIDYLGESGIGRWWYDGDTPGEFYQRPMFPWHAAYCGDIDLTGLRKPISHYRSMLYNEEGEHLYMAVREPDGYVGKVHESQWSTWPTFECWNWKGHEGKNIDVEVYAHYPNVRLYLNDQLVGEKAVAENKATFTLAYQPGTLRAVGVENGQEKESVTLKTANEAKSIRLTADHQQLKADGQDLAYITVELLDENGVKNPVANNLLTATVKGAGTLVGFGNADVKDLDGYTDNTHRAWKGRALLVVRSTNKAGKIDVTVSGDGLKTQQLQIKSK